MKYILDTLINQHVHVVFTHMGRKKLVQGLLKTDSSKSYLIKDVELGSIEFSFAYYEVKTIFADIGDGTRFDVTITLVK